MSNEEKIIELLNDILKWQRVQGIRTLKEIMSTILDSDEKKLTYENTDGIKGVRDVISIVKVGQGTISRWWNEWYSQGILERVGTKYKKIISLKMYNMFSSY